MATEQTPRTRLEQRTNALHLSLRDFADRFGDVATELGERVTVSERQAKRWLAGNTSSLPMPAARRVLEAWFDEPITTLLGPPLATVEPATLLSEREMIMSAGRDSVEHAILSAAALDPAALEQLHAEAQRAARAYFVAPPMAMLMDLVRLRNTVYEQLDRTHKPRQKAELYLIAGQICGLLSSVSWDLGDADVADEQARAAHTYGSVIDHPSLQAWARALQVTAAFWSKRPRRAIAIATEALEIAPRGTASARLRSVRARALAMIGARQEVVADLNAAAGELDYAGDDEFLDETGGELRFDRPRQALCAGAAYVLLGDGDRGETAASTALSLFRGEPEDTRWAAGMLGATIDLGAARALRGDLAGAEAALVPVFALAPERRTEALSQRLENLDRMLGTQQFRGAIEATRIGERIEDFTAGSLACSGRRAAIAAGP